MNGFGGSIILRRRASNNGAWDKGWSSSLGMSLRHDTTSGK